MSLQQQLPADETHDRMKIRQSDLMRQPNTRASSQPIGVHNAQSG
jgi:hypothetical protein